MNQQFMKNLVCEEHKTVFMTFSVRTEINVYTFNHPPMPLGTAKIKKTCARKREFFVFHLVTLFCAVNLAVAFFLHQSEYS